MFHQRYIVHLQLLDSFSRAQHSAGPGFGFGKGPRFLNDGAYIAQPGPGQSADPRSVVEKRLSLV